MKTWSEAIWAIVLGVFFSTMAFAQATPATRETPMASIMQAKSTGADSAKKTKKKGEKKHKGNTHNKTAEKRAKVPPSPRPGTTNSGVMYDM